MDTSRASPADSAADIHDSGAALDVAQPQPQQAGTQVPPILADAGRSPAQQSPPASPADQEPEEKLAEEFSAADADAGQEEISPAQGADFTQVMPRTTRLAHGQPRAPSMIYPHV